MRIIVLFILSIGINNVYAKTSNWISNQDGQWYDVMNWDNGIPSLNDSAIIDIPNIKVIVFGGPIEIEYLYIGNLVTFENFSDISFHESAGDAIVIDGLLKHLAGEILIDSTGGNGIVLNDSIFNEAQITIKDLDFPNNGIYVTNSGHLVNLGLITIVDSPLGILVEGTLTHKGGGIQCQSSSITFFNGEGRIDNDIRIVSSYVSMESESKVSVEGFGELIIDDGYLNILESSVLNNFGSIFVFSENTHSLLIFFSGEFSSEDGSNLIIDNKSDKDGLSVQLGSIFNIGLGAELFMIDN